MTKGSGELGRKPEHETFCVFPCKVTAAGEERYLVCAAVAAAVVSVANCSSYVFCNEGCSCVRSSMRFLKPWWQIALEWLHDVAWALCWGGSRSTKPCVFPCKVTAAGEERYLVCAAVAAAVVSVANCSSYVFCNEWLFLCA